MIAAMKMEGVSKSAIIRRESFTAAVAMDSS